MTYYNRTNTCERIKEDGNLCGNEFHDKAYREKNKDGNWTGRWICQGCYNKERYKNGNTNANLINEMRDHRTGNLNPNCSSAKGDNFEELTCRWRSTVSTIRVENLNKKLDNYRSLIDHTPDSELGIIQTKGRFYNPTERYWQITDIEGEWEKEFDNMICFCASKDGKKIERIYIFPKEDIERVTCITIYKNPTDSHSNPKTSWYDEYRVKDEDTIKRINDIWKEIIKDE